MDEEGQPAAINNNVARDGHMNMEQEIDHAKEQVKVMMLLSNPQYWLNF